MLVIFMSFRMHITTSSWAMQQCKIVIRSVLHCKQGLFDEKQHYKCKTRNPFRLYKEWYIHATNIQLNLRCYNVGQYITALLVNSLKSVFCHLSFFLPSFLPTVLLRSKNNKDDRPLKVSEKSRSDFKTEVIYSQTNGDIISNKH